jgi:EAL domain-containing protein (putative c-di-GMP-specific phosphodiesterase class I)
LNCAHDKELAFDRRDVDTALKTLSELKDMGVRLAIDDFGIGCSSL